MMIIMIQSILDESIELTDTDTDTDIDRNLQIYNNVMIEQREHDQN